MSDYDMTSGLGCFVVIVLIVGAVIGALIFWLVSL